MSAGASGHPSSRNNNTLFLAGPTGVGKSEIAVELALQIGGEIVCGDAFQIYDGLAVLTAQPGFRLTSRVPHHLYGSLPPSEIVSAARLAAIAGPAIDEIRRRGRVPIVVGGSGLYLQAIAGGLDPLPEPSPAIRESVRKLTPSAAREQLVAMDPGLEIDLQNPRRVARALEIILQTGRPLSSLRQSVTPLPDHGFFFCRDRENLKSRIRGNVEAIFAGSAIAEVSALADPSPTARMAIGFREALDLAHGTIPLSEAVECVARATIKYAKRQMTWFRNRTRLDRLEISPEEDAATVAARALRIWETKVHDSL